jgi:hypothetical protein
VAVERRAAYCRVDAPPRRVTDEHAQAFPDEP